MRFLTSAFFIFAYVAALTLANKTQFHELIKSQHKENESLGRNSKSGREEYHGNGNLLCYGNMEVSIVKWDTGTGQGKCKPVPHFGAPQGFIADGEDGSHWVLIFFVTTIFFKFFKFKKWQFRLLSMTKGLLIATEKLRILQEM